MYIYCELIKTANSSRSLVVRVPASEAVRPGLGILLKASVTNG